jgi:mRNA interferase MazF
VLCQITSNPYSDATAVALTATSFAEGGLPRNSFVRPAKLFTASEAIVVRSVGQLSAESSRTVLDALVALFRIPT